jgi:hypothetical protein
LCDASTVAFDSKTDSKRDGQSWTLADIMPRESAFLAAFVDDGGRWRIGSSESRMRHHPVLSFASSTNDDTRHLTAHVGHVDVGSLAPAAPGDSRRTLVNGADQVFSSDAS